MKQIHERPGTTLTEAAVVLSVFLVFVLAMLDVGYTLFRRQMLANAACRAARAASVHGDNAVEPWGPEAVGPVPATDPSPPVQSARALLVGARPEAVVVKVEWPDGGNEAGQRVRVSLSTRDSPILANLFGRSDRVMHVSAITSIIH